MTAEQWINEDYEVRYPLSFQPETNDYRFSPVAGDRDGDAWEIRVSAVDMETAVRQCQSRNPGWTEDQARRQCLAGEDWSQTTHWHWIGADEEGEDQ